MLNDKHDECQYRDRIVEMGTNIRWLVSDAKARNHKFETHIADSDKFRYAVTRNTVWRHAFKFMIGTLTGVMTWLAVRYFG